MNEAVKDFLNAMRSHPSFNEFLKVVERPVIHPFRVSEAEQSEKARAKWIFESGKLHQHQAWLTLLTGKTTSDQENI